MVRFALFAAVVTIGLIGCNGQDDRPAPRPKDTSSPARKEGGVHIDAPGVNVDVERGNKKVNVDVDPKR